MVENLAGLKHGVAAEGMLAVVEPGGHDYDILLLGVGPTQDLTQIVKIFGVTNCDQNIAGADSQSFVLRLFAAIDPELIQAFGFPGALPGHPSLRVSENCKKHQAE